MQPNGELNRTVWDPFRVFHGPEHYKYALVVLNQPISWETNGLLEIWEKADITVTVDGGTESWMKYLEDQGKNVLTKEHAQYVPDLITGDMDSCPPLVLEKLKTLGSTVIQTPDQNETDYTKALRQLGQHAKMKSINLNAVFVLVELTGRFDHIIANINTLYKADKLIEDVQLFQFSKSSLTWLLQPGFHTIGIPEILLQHNSCCGLLPIGSPVNRITTTGLKWNLDNAVLQFGGMVSTSNTYNNCSEVTVETDSSLIWTMSIDPIGEIMKIKL